MLLLFLKKLVLFQIAGIHTLLKFSFQNRLLSYIWRDEVWLRVGRNSNYMLFLWEVFIAVYECNCIPIA